MCADRVCLWWWFYIVSKSLKTASLLVGFGIVRDRVLLTNRFCFAVEILQSPNHQSMSFERENDPNYSLPSIYICQQDDDHCVFQCKFYFFS